jgi:peptidoglycan/LPS O-acetylase OafA/YrhL
MKRVFGLDVLRTVAITQVLLGHGLTIYVGQQSKKLLEGFYGFLGVELFFVLSGFLVGSIALAMFDERPTPAGAGDFVLRRWLRTLPNYYLFLGVNVALNAWIGGPPADWRYLLFLQNLLWPMPPFFGESWSLAVEELFYLVLPLLLLALAAFTRSTKALLVGLCVALGLFTLARLAYVAAYDPGFHEFVRKTSALRLDSLMYGVVAAWLFRHARETFLKGRALKLALGLLVVIASVRAVVVLAPQSSLAASAAVSGVSLGVALMLPFLSTWQAAPGQARALFEWTSRVSYALYLCHLPTTRVLEWAGLPKGLGGMLIWIAACCVVATIVHFAFERPIMAMRERLPGSRRAPAPKEQLVEGMGAP